MVIPGTVGAIVLVFRCDYSLERGQLWQENSAKAGELNARITLRFNEPFMHQRLFYTRDKLFANSS